VGPIRDGLQTKREDIIIKVLTKFQAILRLSPECAQAYIPHYKVILPVMNLLKTKNRNTGDKIEIKQITIGDVILKTLETMERCSGGDAFFKIKQ
jgi:hypothetical protein